MPALDQRVDHLQTSAAGGCEVQRPQAGFEHRPVLHGDDDGPSVEAHRQLKSSASVVDGIGYQLVRDEQNRLRLGSGNAPSAKLVGKLSSRTCGRGQNRRECPTHPADSW
jgi:hypothetical protein